MTSPTLIEAVVHVLSSADAPMSPGQIKDEIKNHYPHLYQTERHREGIEKGNYKSFDHGLLNDIYALVKRSSDFSLDRSQRPMLVSLVGSNGEEVVSDEEDYESDRGTLYVLSTGTFTSEGKAIVKIGHTTQALESRISQLYTTGTPFAFTPIRSWLVSDYMALEQAVHRLLSPFRINRAREFFTEDAVPLVEYIVAIHCSARDEEVNK